LYEIELISYYPIGYLVHIIMLFLKIYGCTQMRMFVNGQFLQLSWEENVLMTATYLDV